MKIRDWQYIATLETGATYETKIIDYFKIDTSQTAEEIQEEITLCLSYNEDYQLKRYFNLHGKVWVFERELLDCTFEQWIRLETLTSEEKNLENLHRILAIYCRPTKRKLFKRKIEPFDLEKQDKIAEELLDLPMEIANALVLFFWNLVPRYTNYIKIPFLTQLNQQHLHTRKKSIR